MIRSTGNPRLKELRKLRARKHRERTGRFVAEGEDLLAEALRAGRSPAEVYVAAGATASSGEATTAALAGHGLTPVEVEPAVLDWASSLGSGTRVIGVWKKLEGDLGAAPVVVYLEGVRDPGNIGTIIRALHAFTKNGVLALGPGCADPFSPKAVRASMGSIFARPPVHADFDRVAALEATRIALAPRAGRPLAEVALEGPTVICLGSERTALSRAVLDGCDEVAHIPTLSPQAGGADSLNVAMAATVALYEVMGRLRGSVSYKAEHDLLAPVDEKWQAES